MAEYGIVKKCKGEFLEIALNRSEACKHCNACLPSLTDKTMILTARNDCNAKEGDYVSVAVEQSGFLSAILLLYFIPALAFIAGILIFTQFISNEWISLGLSLILVGITWLIVHRIAPKLKQERYLPVAVKVLDVPQEILEKVKNAAIRK